MNSILRWRIRNAMFFLFAACIAFPALAQNTLEQNLGVARSMQQDSAASQKRIDQLAAETESMLQEYQRLKTDADYQTRYEAELRQLEQQQSVEMESLQQQLQTLQHTRKRLIPLMRSMVESLERFVVLDLPFHRQQRLDAVISLREKVFSGQLLLADKFRLLMEAYQAELAYGNTLEHYRDQINVQGEASQTLTVEVVRIGRLALYYLTPDGQRGGLWNAETRQWEPLPDDQISQVRTALKVAAGQVAPELLDLPLAHVSIQQQDAQAKGSNQLP